MKECEDPAFPARLPSEVRARRSGDGIDGFNPEGIHVRHPREPPRVSAVPPVARLSMTASYTMEYIVARNVIGNQSRRTLTAERITHWR